ncbi:PREDICTED: peptidyl-prolyl cis-trans isomerase FKBP43-like isoform X1 [Lupinus angustifolius]|uniref:peptidyl-prolyl cis-trans isomerase FKBP43-like isoform X1 n=1 Tax=Lupinus angustifolius TaxID=3871 RepID=UPI00092E6713|nr:PREDICTED: peptidyl-prolyl cis-trans isomerase FKBP43-like isoform X1 [Lupinus angustifolius]
MAFWGVEVKPGKPFTHKYDNLKGRLHISMATLGFGSSTSKSILQCNIGNRSPIYLCSLYPGNTESLQLNLELEEEADQVIFSVIGPRSIHICGYYLSSSFSNPTNHHSEEESFGEDIANTESDNSADDDDYDDSFIDDQDHPQVFPPSPLSSQEETSIDNKPKRKKTGLRRLRKYQSVESDDDDDDNNCSEEKNTLHNDQTKEIIDDEDSLPISSLYKNKASEKVLHQEMDDDRAAGDATHKSAEDGATNIIETAVKTENVIQHSQTHSREVEVLDPCTVLDVGSIKKEKKKKKKGKTKETKNSCNGHFIQPDNDVQEEPKMDKMTHDLLAGKEQYQEHADNKETETFDKMVASSEVIHGQGEKPKRKRKERSKEEGIAPIVSGADHSNIVNDASPPAETPEKRKKRKKKEHVKEDSHLEGDNAHHEDIMNKHKSRRDAAEFDNVIHKFPEGKGQHQKVTNENVVDIGAHDLPDGNQSEDRKVKKKKKKSKSRGDEEDAKSFEQSSDVVKEDGNKRADAKPSNVKTLSSGVVIEELEMGIKDGKIAESGKRISVHYTGMLKENGVVFESNAGQAPLKFRLGKGEVCEGWDVGLEGMRVGEKRRLVIPPSMMSKSEGQSATIPSNSWLVYELELVKVH